MVCEGSSWIILRITGDSSPDYFRNESGKHTFQRVPPTESKGRRHTSIVSVHVFAETDLPPARTEIEIIQQKFSRGAGGQKINKTSSGIRARDKISGIEVIRRSRKLKDNKEDALSELQKRIQEKSKRDFEAIQNTSRQDSWGEGKRSGKIRTYNFIDGYVLDHVTGKKTHDIKGVMKGRLDLLK